MGIEVTTKKSKKTGLTYWRLTETGNHEVIAIGGEPFASRTTAEQGYRNVEEEILKAAIERYDLVVFRREELLKAIEEMVAGTFSPDDLIDTSVYK